LYASWNVARRQLDKRKVAEGWSEKILNNLSVAFMRLRGDFFAHSSKPRCEPLPNCHSTWINVLAGIERS